MLAPVVGDGPARRLGLLNNIRARANILFPRTHLQIGAIMQYITTLVRSHDELPDPGHGIEHQSG